MARLSLLQWPYYVIHCDVSGLTSSSIIWLSHAPVLGVRKTMGTILAGFKSVQNPRQPHHPDTFENRLYSNCVTCQLIAR